MLGYLSQAYQCKSALAATTTAATATFTVDRGNFVVRRLKFHLSGDSDAVQVRIKAGGELLYGGSLLSISNLALRTDQVVAAGSAHESPYVLAFDVLPLPLSKDYPLEITYATTSGSQTVTICLEAARVE